MCSRAVFPSLNIFSLFRKLFCFINITEPITYFLVNWRCWKFSEIWNILIKIANFRFWHKSYSGERMFRLELLVVVLIVAESSTTKSTTKSRSSFLDQELNNTMVMVTTGEDLTLNCRVQRFQVIKWLNSMQVLLSLDFGHLYNSIDKSFILKIILYALCISNRIMVCPFIQSVLSIRKADNLPVLGLLDIY